MLVTFDLTQEEADRIDVVFAGGEVMHDRIDILNGLAQHSANYLADVIEWRSNVAITGAMRWPWSQEAVIVNRTQFSYV